MSPAKKKAPAKRAPAKRAPRPKPAPTGEPSPGEVVVVGPPLPPNPPPPLPPPVLDEPPLPQAPWRWWEALIVFALALVTFFLVGGIIHLIAPGTVGDAVTIVAFEVTLGFWAFMWVKVRYGAGFGALGVSADRLSSDIWTGIGTGLVGVLVASVIVGQIVIRIVQSTTHHVVTQPEQLQLGTTPPNLALAITAFGVIVVAPFAEELFFRGLVFRGFRRRFSIAPAALLSGAVFAFAHVPYWIIMPSIATLGIILAFVFERRRSLIPTMVAHAVFNTIGFTAYLVTTLRR